MIIDTSAIISILPQEEDAGGMAKAIKEAPSRRMSAATLLEATIVLRRRGVPALVGKLDALLEEAEVEIVSVTRPQVEIARRACEEYGKGHHPAALNFGDCFAYALAKAMDEPLLFKGNDFSQTDIKRVPV